MGAFWLREEIMICDLTNQFHLVSRNQHEGLDLLSIFLIIEFNG